jgi:DnaK suppressor protein
MLGDTEDEGNLSMIRQGRKSPATFQDRDFAWLKRVSEAVERIENGNYGECLSCGGDIDEETLDAVPWVALCLRCTK